MLIPMRRWQTFSLFALSELVCTKNVFYPILLFPLLSHPKLLPLWSVTDRSTTLRGSSPAFLAKKKVSEQKFRQPHHNHLTSINVNIERPDDGNILITRKLLDALRAKICWGILTPWWRIVPFWLAYPCDVSKFSVHFGPHSRLLEIHFQRTIVLVYSRYELRPWLSPGQSLPFGPGRVWGAFHCRQPGALYQIWLSNEADGLD